MQPSKYLIFLLLSLPFSTIAAVVEIEVNGISVMEGHLLVVLCQGKEAYDDGESRYFRKQRVTSASHNIVFEQVDPGEYAVKLYHDENDNGKLDKNFIGIPKEGYGFSNNGGRFGSPSFEKASFVVEENTMLSIKLN